MSKKRVEFLVRNLDSWAKCFIFAPRFVFYRLSLMSRYLFAFLFFLFLLTDVCRAQGKLDLHLLRAIRQQQSASLAPDRTFGSTETSNADTRMTVLAVLNPQASLPFEQLQSLGVGIGRQVGRVVTLSVPLNQLEAVSQLQEVESLNANRRHQISCLNARTEMHIDFLHDDAEAQSLGFPQGYTGRGVLLGIVDTGIQYDHLNFRDAQTGRSRLLGAALYRPEQGLADSIREYYTEPSQLDTLTTDDPLNGHGTLTAGAAAGSYYSLRQQGMAPDASLMLCGTSELEDDRLIDALCCTFARADELGMPCVVNLSIGNPVGWKDGLSPLALVCDSLTEGGNAPGRVIIFSAGNDGDKPYAADYLFEDSRPVHALLEPCSDKAGTSYINPNLDIYCSDDQPVSVEFALYDTLLHTWSHLPFEQHVLDTLEAGHGMRRHLCVDADTCMMQPYPHCLIGARIQGRVGSSFTAYYVNHESVKYRFLMGGNDDRWLQGTSSHSISDLCTTDAVLSVGAYSTVDSLVNIFGRTHYPWAPSGEVCSFSSYGYTAQGSPKPDVLCPGASVVSSYSSYYQSKIDYYYTSGSYPDSPMMHVVEDEGRQYYWIHDVGTSLSSPILAGIVAMWLEANPTLSVRQLREVLAETSRFDAACLHAPGGSLQVGSGKVDAIRGLRRVLAMAGIESLRPLSAPSIEAPCYDLHGRPVSDPTHHQGLVFMGGQKRYQR